MCLCAVVAVVVVRLMWLRMGYTHDSRARGALDASLLDASGERRRGEAAAALLLLRKPIRGGGEPPPLRVCFLSGGGARAGFAVTVRDTACRRGRFDFCGRELFFFGLPCTCLLIP